MKAHRFGYKTVLAISVAWAVPAQAQSADTAAVERELATMRAQMQTMAQRIDSLEAQLAAAKAAKAPEHADATPVAPATAPAAAAADKPVQVTWDGGPKFSNDKGWSFKPRGRLQVDVGGVNAPEGLSGKANDHLGTSTELRRAYLGFDGTIPGGFGYRMEADFAASSVQITDLYLTYRPDSHWTFTAGQHKAFWGLEEMTSDLFTSNMERAAFTSAFGFERRLGLSAQYLGKIFLVQGGVFSDDVASLNNDNDKNWSLDGRIVAMPSLAGGTLHLGVSGHWRDLNAATPTVRYSARPFIHTTDVRFIDTGNLTAIGERGFGGELAWIRGRFHASAESFWQTIRRPGLPDPTFNGGYAELGYLLTNDVTAYKNGVYDRIVPKRGLDKGGIGAIQLNARYDWLDLNDAGIVGGRQQIAGVSAIWMPIAYVRFILNYGHIWIDDSAIDAAGDRNFTADALGMRAQLDF